MRINRTVATATVIAISIIGLLLAVFSWNAQGTATITHVEAQTDQAQPSEEAPARKIELIAAIEQGWVQAGFRGDGMDILYARFKNLLAEPLEIIVPEGCVLETKDGSTLENQIIIVRRTKVKLPADGEADERLYSAATNSGNRTGDYTFIITRTRLPLVEPMLHYLVKYPAYSARAVQTAVLAITENLPMSAFAKFTLARDSAPSLLETNDFRVDVRDILNALELLRSSGFDESRLALAVDPQLKIEAMCDRLSHEPALVYYGITRETEWQFWHDELLKGDPATRHYALYGIARYFPDVAVEMMPKWARAEKLSSVFRISSVIAMAETRRPEALSVLAQLNYEFAGSPELKRATEEATRYLENYVSPPSRRPADIEWRLVQTMKMLTGGQ